MKLRVNGEYKDFEAEITITALLIQLGLEGKKIAVELNEEIIPSSKHTQTSLKEGDYLEIVHAIGGG